MRRLTKPEMRQRGREFRALLNEWDPVGIGIVPGSEDEYDCLLWPVMRMLEQDSSVDLLTTYLTQELRERFGLDPKTQSVAEFAQRAKDWFGAAWQGTRV